MLFISLIQWSRQVFHQAIANLACVPQPRDLFWYFGSLLVISSDWQKKIVKNSFGVFW